MEYYAQIFFQLLSDMNAEEAWKSFEDILAFEGVEPDRMEDIQEYVLEEWRYTWTE